MNIILKEVNSDNFDECIELEVSEKQKGFVASNLYSIAQSKVLPGCKPLCIYDGEKMVGFAMYEIDTEDDDISICRLMIDKKYQNKGYGRAAMIKLLKLIKENYKYKEVYISTEPENHIAQGLYESLGFKKNGQVLEGEVVSVLKF
ncbi:GNAT family N-acetyltransferase [Dethiothermospora halolimnae]|uniref:GNAT family N-acetyltransferase n=1 Tax=Dethiothermospora halolimnae TaxID=3114390 RepID=UPI003CCBCCBE